MTDGKTARRYKSSVWARSGGMCRRTAALALGALAAAVILAAGAMTAAFGEEGYSFHSPAIEAEVCRQLGKEPGTVTLDNLGQITRLYLCGDEHFDRWEQMEVHGAELTIDGRPAPTGGTVDTLEDIPNFPALEELALCNQRVTDLSPLAGKWVIRLALHGNEITDLSPLGQCQHMMDLYIGDNPVQDLSPLAACPELRTLCAGATGITDLEAVAAIPKLEYLWLMDCPALTDLSALGGMDRLVCLFLRPAKSQDLELVGGMTGLEQLYLWCGEPQADMTALSGLTGLRRLYADMPVASLDGIEALTGLEYLDVRSGETLDPAPLAALTALEELNVSGMDTDALEDVLPALPSLARVGCSAGQTEAVGRILAGRSGVDISAWE